MEIKQNQKKSAKITCFLTRNMLYLRSGGWKQSERTTMMKKQSNAWDKSNKVDSDMLHSFLVDMSDKIEEENEVKELAGRADSVIHRALGEFRSGHGDQKGKPETEFGIFLTLLRRREHLSPEDLAERADVDPKELRVLDV